MIWSIAMKRTSLRQLRLPPRTQPGTDFRKHLLRKEIRDRDRKKPWPSHFDQLEGYRITFLEWMNLVMWKKNKNQWFGWSVRRLRLESQSWKEPNWEQRRIGIARSICRMIEWVKRIPAPFHSSPSVVRKRRKKPHNNLNSRNLPWFGASNLDGIRDSAAFGSCAFCLSRWLFGKLRVKFQGCYRPDEILRTKHQHQLFLPCG